MTREEMIQRAQQVRLEEEQHLGTVPPEELAALPGTQTERLIDVGDRKIHVYVLQPEAPLPGPAPLLINFHGGGFIKGRSGRDQRYCASILQAAGCLVWDVDYRYAPEYPFPAAVDDCYDLAAWVFAHAAEIGADPARIALSGHSAGGTLVAAVLIKDAEARRLSPCCALMEYFPGDDTVDPLDRLTEELKQDPWNFERAEQERTYQNFYSTPEDRKSPLCSPLRASREQLVHFPDSLVISAGQDSLRAETEAFAMRLLDAGVTVTAKRIPEARHGFTTLRTEGWERALALQTAFFRQHFSR